MRIEQLTFTRFVAAFSICVHHYGLGVFPFNHTSLHFLLGHIEFGVSYFFILSGFVMMMAYGRQPETRPRVFLKNRFARIAPAYFLALVLLVLYVAQTGRPLDREGLFLNLFFVQAWIPGKALAFNGPGWSLSVEVFFYLLFPFLQRVYSRYSYKVLILPVGLFWLGTQILFHLALPPDLAFANPFVQLLFYFPPMHLSGFLVGNLAGLAFLQMPGSRARNYDLTLLALLVGMVVAIRYNFGLNFHNGLLAVFFVPLFFLLSLNTGRITTLLKWRPLVFLGEISYGMYILQVPVYLWFGGILSGMGVHHPVILFYGTLFVLIFIAAVSYTTLEQPVRKWVRE